MLAIARAMMLEPKIILLDEPTEGLMPRMVSQIREIIDALHQEGVAILLVEQNVPLTLAVEPARLLHGEGRGAPPRRGLGAQRERSRHPPVSGSVSMGMLAAIPWDIIAIQTVNGIVTGMILALVASGLTLIFGIMDVVNFAHGELFMLGAYIGVIVLTATGSFWLALIARLADRRAARRGAAGDDAAPAARPRSADHDPRHLRHLAGAAELCAVAVRPGGAQDPGAVHRPVHALLSASIPGTGW